MSEVRYTPFHINNKVILVTGASSGIGKQVAISASAMGAQVVLTGRDPMRLQDTLASLSGIGHLSITADLLDATQRERLIEKIPQLDGFVNCAGVVKPTPVRFLNEDKISETMDINYQVPVLLTAALLKRNKVNKNASFVFVSSIASQFPYRGGSMYSGSKAAIESFVMALALELSTRKIRANSLSPAMVKTPMFNRTEEEVSPEEMSKHLDSYLLGVGLPEDVANAAVFLLSEASRWITGTNIILDGGHLLSRK